MPCSLHGRLLHLVAGENAFRFSGLKGSSPLAKKIILSDSAGTDVSDIQGRMIKDCADEYDIDLSKIMESDKKK